MTTKLWQETGENVQKKGFSINNLLVLQDMYTDVMESDTIVHILKYISKFSGSTITNLLSRSTNI